MSTSDIAAEGMDFLRRGYERLNRGELLAFAEILSPDFIINMPFEMAEPMHGPGVWKEGTQNIVDGFPDIQAEIQDMFGSGDRVAVRLVFRATHTGTFLGIAPTGRRVEFNSVELYRFAAPDKVVEEWVYPDIRTLMRQITSEAESR